MYSFYEFLSEKSISVGSGLNKLLSSTKNDFTIKLMGFLNSDAIRNEFKYDSVDWSEQDEKLLSLTDNNGKVTKIKLMKLLSMIGFDNDYNEYDINRFILSMKKGDESKLKLLSGEDIYWAYDCKNYAAMGKNPGDLHTSCMRYSHKVNFLEIYAKNPNQVSLLVLMDGDKVAGRALLWTDKSVWFQWSELSAPSFWCAAKRSCSTATRHAI